MKKIFSLLLVLTSLNCIAQQQQYLGSNNTTIIVRGNLQSNGPITTLDYLGLPVRNTVPALGEGRLWYEQATSEIKVYKNGVAKKLIMEDDVEYLGGYTEWPLYGKDDSIAIQVFTGLDSGYMTPQIWNLKANLISPVFVTPRLSSTSTINYVWTATDGNGNGSWQAASVGVVSFNSRTGTVVPATNDYTWAQINKTTSSLADIATRSAGDLSSGTLPDARLSSNVVQLTTNQTLTNKTLTSPKINVGSDATGDIYYRDDSGNYVRLGVGSTGQVLKVSSGIPSWGTDNDTGGGSATSGIYTPTTTNVTNVTNSSNVFAHYTQVGNEVIISIILTIQTTGSGLFEVGVSLPSGLTSNFTTANDALGSGSWGQEGSGSAANFYVIADETNDRLALKGYAAGGATVKFYGTLTYTIK